MHILADAKSFTDHFLLQVANMVDRTLRAEGTSAKANITNYVNSSGEFPEYRRKSIQRERHIVI